MLFELDFLLRRRNLEDVLEFIKKNIQKRLLGAQVAFLFFIGNLTSIWCNSKTVNFNNMLVKVSSVRFRSNFLVKLKPNMLVKPLSLVVLVENYIYIRN